MYRYYTDPRMGAKKENFNPRQNAQILDISANLYINNHVIVNGYSASIRGHLT